MDMIKKLIRNSSCWKQYRYRKILRTHAKVTAFWTPIIKEYGDGLIRPYEMKPKVHFGNQKIIWQYWGQGFDDKSLPEIVRICSASVDRYKGDYQVIRLSDETIEEYLDFPEYVWEKREKGIFSRTIFSDLLRVCLLSVYGGVWLDATILLTHDMPMEYTAYDFFMYQRDKNEQHKRFWMDSYAFYWGWDAKFKVNVLNSILFAKKDTRPINTMRDLLMYYWQTEDKLIDYFVFQILFTELVEKGAIENCPIVNDTYPHILQSMITGQYPWMNLAELNATVPIHKMSYFDESGINKLKDLLKQL